MKNDKHTKDRISHILIILTLLFSVLSSAVGKERPNVLLICIDDLKPLLGCYGDTKIHSPNIDRLADRGMLFTRAYCNQAVCAPSRNTLLTGSRPTTLGIYDLGTHFREAVPDAITLPQYFKQHGWRSEGLGKIFHVGHGNHEDADSWSVPHMHEKVIDYALPESTAGGQLTREEAYFSNQALDRIHTLPRGAAYEIADVPDDAYADGRIANEAIKRLGKAKENSEEPLFLALGFVKPHLPFCAPKKYWDLYDREDFPLPERYTPPDGAPFYAPQFGGELRQYAGIPENGPLPEELQRVLIHGYHATVSYMDAQLGRVLDELERLELAKDTIIVLWGDHGWHLGDHGMWCKHTNYEQANRIPIIIAAPGVTDPGGRSDAMIETIDLYPTICELAGLPAPDVPQQLDGVSLLPILHDPSAWVKRHVQHVFPRGRRLGHAVRTERYRLVEWRPRNGDGASDFELYDYETDPRETKNRAPEQPELVRRLRVLIDIP